MVRKHMPLCTVGVMGMFNLYYLLLLSLVGENAHQECVYISKLPLSAKGSHNWQTIIKNKLKKLLYLLILFSLYSDRHFHKMRICQFFSLKFSKNYFSI